MSEVPALVLETGESVSLLDEKLSRRFSKFPAATQRKAVRKMEEFLQEAYANASVAHLIALGLLTPENARLLKEGDAAQLKHSLIDACSWQLAQFLRYSTPSRIGEAVAPLTFLVEAHKRINGKDKVDVIPALYLGVALSRNLGEEERAVRIFTQAIDSIPNSGVSPVKNLLWARANMANLLRNMNRIPEAMEQEKLAREWILTHPYAKPPTELRATLIDGVCTGAHILDHPSVVSLFSTINEIGPDTAICNGLLIKYNISLF